MAFVTGLVKLTNGLSSAPLQISSILASTFTGTNLATGQPGSTTITDSDSLIKAPSGGLALTGEADQAIVFIDNPGAANQSERFINLLGTNGQTITGNPDDTVYPTATQGFVYVADTGANTVYKLTGTGLTPGSVYVDVGNEFGSLNLSTGVVTPMFTGVSPHGAQFVTLAQAAVPEPNSISLIFGAMMLGAGVASRRRFASRLR